MGHQVRAARVALVAVALAAALVAGGAATARAEQGEAAAPAASTPAASKPAASTPAASKPAPADRWGDGRASRDPREQPAHGSPYAWRQMAMGVGIMLLMLAFVIWLVRRQTRAP
ncbi:MAG TPA: hypothetical protein VK698_14545 [Kofleriaceae bacterium]|nr:hypothetical protein [Kofleriaceae bacterium]